MCKCEFPDGVSINLGGVPVSPCKYELVGKYKNVTVDILKCSVCGDVSIGWYRQDDTEDIIVDDLEG